MNSMYAELAIEITENGNYTPVLTLAWTRDVFIVLLLGICLLSSTDFE